MLHNVPSTETNQNDGLPRVTPGRFPAVRLDFYAEVKPGLFVPADLPGFLDLHFFLVFHAQKIIANSRTCMAQKTTTGVKT